MSSSFGLLRGTIRLMNGEFFCYFVIKQATRNKNDVSTAFTAIFNVWFIDKKNSAYMQYLKTME